MNKTPPNRSQTYDASDRKTFHSALCHLLQTEFPGTFGPSVTKLFADRVHELYDRFHVPRERLKVGQVLWAAVAVDDPPARDKRIEQTRLVPIVLDLVTPRDIDDAIATGVRTETRDRKILRLFQQAYEQGAVLSYPDVSLLLHVQTSTISRTVLAHERETKTTVPRRGTIHDMGRSVTHKAIICYKRLVELKPTSQVASETYHSPEEVEYYVQCLRRVKLCLDSGMSPTETAQATGHSVSLVSEYSALIQQLGLPKTSGNPSSANTTDIEGTAPETNTEQPRHANVPNDPY
jgi:hypothetical protein